MEISFSNFWRTKKKRKNITGIVSRDLEKCGSKMTSYPAFFRKYTSDEPILVKIDTIVHFDHTSSQKKFRTIPTILMTS